MVTHGQLVRYYLLALRHWEAHPAVRELCAGIDLGRRGYCELFASRHLDATAWTTGGALSGNAAYDDAVALLSHSGRGGGARDAWGRATVPPALADAAPSAAPD